jgi:hypothetical protein
MCRLHVDSTEMSWEQCKVAAERAGGRIPTNAEVASFLRGRAVWRGGGKWCPTLTEAGGERDFFCCGNEGNYGSHRARHKSYPSGYVVV